MFTSVEIDILHIFAFSQMMKLLYSQAHWCLWKSLTIRVLGSGLLMDVNGGSTFLARRMKQTCLKCSKESSLCWFCFEFWPSCTILLVVECCRLAQCICSLILGYFVMFYWCDPRTSVLLVRWLHCIFTCVEIDMRTVHSCLFADDGAFILASTLVPVEEFDDQSAWLRVVYAGSTVLLDAWSRHVV